MKVDKIVIHCSATRAGMDIGVAEIDRWHKDNGWSGIGYHWVIRRNGTIEPGRSEKLPGAHAAGHNEGSIAICYAGGVNVAGKPEDNRTQQQKDSMLRLVLGLLALHPDAHVLGHCDLPGVKKACPSFSVRDWLESSGIPQYWAGAA